MAVKERHSFSRFVNFEGFNWNSAKSEKLLIESYNFIFTYFVYSCRNDEFNLNLN